MSRKVKCEKCWANTNHPVCMKCFNRMIEEKTKLLNELESSYELIYRLEQQAEAKGKTIERLKSQLAQWGDK